MGAIIFGENSIVRGQFPGAQLFSGVIFRGQLSGEQSSRGKLSGGQFSSGAIVLEPLLWFINDTWMISAKV